MAAINAVKGDSTRFALAAAERALVDALGSGDMPPFLGHHRLPTHIALKLRDEIRCGVGRIEIRLRLLFYLWPALTTAWIAQTVAERYGTIAQIEVYPHLSALLGVPNLDPNSRIRIAKLFRHACTRLDLPLPEAGEAVDAYVVQGGVPHTQIDRLADALVKAERRVGLPDMDDDLAVAMFTDLAACAVDAGHPRLRKVLEHDTVGWYARLWTMLRERPEDAPDDAFVRLLAEAASANANARGAGLRRPCLAWREGLLAVEIPEGQSRRWALAAEGWRQEVAGQAAPVVVALPLPWPSAIEWQAGSLVRRRADVGTLEPPAREWVAVFAATGRLVARAQFHSPDESMRPVRLARGDYDLVCSARFLGPEGIEASGVPGGCHLRIEIGERPLKLLRGSRSITLAAVQRPELKLLGPGVCDLHGRTIYGERGLSVRVIWPQTEDEHDLSEVEEEPAETRPVRPTAAKHELLIEIPAKDLPSLPIDHGAAEGVGLNIGQHLTGMQPVLRRVVLKLVRRGERRSLARTAAFVWVGLERSDGRRFVGQRPANLSAAACLNLDIKNDRVALSADRSYATARLVVDDVDGKSRRETFEFAYPGLVAVLRWLDADGVRREQVLERDAVIALRPGDARLLEVSSPDPGAILLVGTEVRPQAFLNRSRIGIPLATVADACRGGADQLAVRGADGISITLARFTVPCEVVRWTVNFDRLKRERSLLLGFHEPAQQLRVRVRDLWGGTKAEVVLRADALRRRAITNGMSLRLEQDVSGPLPGVHLVLELDDWPSGLWLMDLDAQLGQGGRWQALVNLRGDIYALLLSHGLDEILAGDVGQRLGFADQIQIFARCHKELQRCFAPACWQGGVDEILRLWRRVGGSLATDPRLERYWPALLTLAFIEPPLEASESWLPLVSFWDVLPEFMALRGPSYAVLRQIGRDDTAVLALLAELADAGSVARFLHQSDRLDVQFFRCFANLAEVHRSDCLTECRGFSFRAYADHMRRAPEDGDDLGWLPSEPMLSSSHYLTAFESLVRRYRTLTAGQGNAQRLPGAARLVQDALRWLDREGRSRAEAAIPDLALDSALLALSVPVDENEDALLQDAPIALSAIAFACRLEPRRPGTLNAFIASLAGADRDRDKVSADLNFLTAAGADLFAFWLLFWDVLLTTGERCRI